MTNIRRGREAREKRQKAAKERQEAWDALSPTEKVKVLDDRLGVGVGAHKQRSRSNLPQKKPSRNTKK